MNQRFSAVRVLTDEEEAEIQALIASDPDNPELTDEQLAAMRPFREVFPELAAAIDQGMAERGSAPSNRPTEAISILLDRDVIDKFRATGPGWQNRINEVLRAAKVEAA